MAGRALALFERLQTREAIESLIGQPEDADFDCKVWRGLSETTKGSIAKAACGFANATGGVIVIGVRAAGRGSNIPDVVRELQPVADVRTVTSSVLDIILSLVEPGIEGVQVHGVSESPGGKAGYVLVLVPEAAGSPCRSRADNRFYVRVASGTLPMEYFQIEDRFGRRPHAKLTVQVSDTGLRAEPILRGHMERVIRITVSNTGRGLARFPALRCSMTGGLVPASIPFSGLETPVWPLLQSDGWLSFRGAANDVLYPTSFGSLI